MVPDKSRVTSRAQVSSNPYESLTAAAMDPTAEGATPSAGPGQGQKKRKNKPKQKKRNRRQSFAAPSDQGDAPDMSAQLPSILDAPESATTESQFARIGGRRTSNISLDSEALLDHRDQPHTRPRRQSLLQNMHGIRSIHSHLHHTRPSHRSPRQPTSFDGIHNGESRGSTNQDARNDTNTTDRTPLLNSMRRESSAPRRSSSYNGYYGSPSTMRPMSNSNRRPSASSSISRRRRIPNREKSSTSIMDDFDVNNPPSQPGSPRLGGGNGFDEVMLPGFDHAGSPGPYENTTPFRDTIIDVDGSGLSMQKDASTTPRSPSRERRNTFWGRQIRPIADEDVCVPFDQMTEIAEEDSMHQEGGDKLARRSRRKAWPDLEVLEEWSQEEKEERTIEGVRAKKVNEPEMVGGRLRPSRVSWQKEEEEEAIFRYTYFNEELDSSLRSYTLSGLQQLGHSFRELFLPDRPLLEEESSDEDELISLEQSGTPLNGQSRTATRHSSTLEQPSAGKASASADQSGRNTPSKPQQSGTKAKRYGPRPVFWLDVLQPTFEEMKVISRAFGIHKLTAEDIMEQEAREKVELFRNYYFVNYRTFEQDQQSEEYMSPVNMYFVVFKGGVISFHFSQMPHPPNVRRRIRQLAEHQYTDSDWISYAIIDNITDAYAPIIEQIEKDVDDIDDEILRLHTRQPGSESMQQPLASRSSSKGAALLCNLRKASTYTGPDYEKVPTDGADDADMCTEASDRDMLFRVGECRKKVMGLYRLLGNKADVIKGLAKRCNEQWQVAPRSDVGLYLGDIQDHIVTMTGNLTHYESILSRAHSNYLAQINIKMTERAEQTNDVLGKLTVLGTIVLPMNIITGMWGMNVTVPGQDNGNMLWFWGITAGLFAFGASCFFIARRFYRVV